MTTKFLFFMVPSLRKWTPREALFWLEPVLASPLSTSRRRSVAAPARRLDPEDVARPELGIDLGAELGLLASGDERVPAAGARLAAPGPIGRELAALRDDGQGDG